MVSIRLFLGAQALLLAGFGAAYFMRPHEMGTLSGMLLMEPAAVTDVRAYYGALQVGVAVFLCFGIARVEFSRPVLLLLLVLFSSLAVGRVLGMWLDGGAQQTFNLWALLYELVSAALAGWLFKRT